MAFDECSDYGCSEDYAKTAMERTLNWLDRCTKAHGREEQMLFPIIQGNFFARLREESAKATIPYAKCGIAVGGLSVGELPRLCTKCWMCFNLCIPKICRATLWA